MNPMLYANPQMTPIQAMQPLFKQVECGYRPVPHNVEPPIARAEHLQNMIRQLKRDRDMYQRLLADTEKMLADYEVIAGSVPF